MNIEKFSLLVGLYDARSVANFYSSVLSFFSAYLFRGDSYIRSPAVEITSIEEDKPYYHDSYCPIHGSRKRFRRPQLKDVGSYHLTSIESVEMEPTSVILLRLMKTLTFSLFNFLNFLSLSLQFTNFCNKALYFQSSLRGKNDSKEETSNTFRSS